MGTYTEFSFNARLKHDTPKDVIDLLFRIIVKRNIGTDKFLFTTNDVNKPEIQHPFFETDRWYMLFLSNNFSEDIKASEMKFIQDRWEINIHSEFKNYDNEIDLFIDWIKPYIIGRKKKQYVGFYEVEGHDEKLNLYIKRI